MAGICDTFQFLTEQEIIAKVKTQYNDPNLPVYFKCSKVDYYTLKGRYYAFFDEITRIIERIQYDVIFYKGGIALVIVVAHDANKCSHFVHSGLFEWFFNFILPCCQAKRGLLNDEFFFFFPSELPDLVPRF